MLVFVVNRAGSPVRREETLCFHAGTQVGSWLEKNPWPKWIEWEHHLSVKEMFYCQVSLQEAHVKFRGILQVMVIVSFSKMFFASDCWSTMCLAVWR